MPRTGSIRLATIFGIRIGASTSWFVVLFFFIYLLSGAFRNALGPGRDTAAYATAVASALAFFLSLILHELGHALVARRLGIGISGIDLWFFGGIAKMTRDTASPSEELKVAIAGPAVTLAIVALCSLIGIAIDGPQGFWGAIRLSSVPSLTPALLLLSWLATINAGLLVLNLMPAFPLDGGRIARAVAWWRTGDRMRATQLAAGAGRGFSYLLIGLGIFLALRGDLIDGIWLAALGLFIGQAARGAVIQTAVTERLGAVTVADIMDRNPVAVPSDLSLERARDEFFLRYRWPWFPVVDPDGRYVGLVRQERVDGPPATPATVGQVMETDHGEGRVVEDTPLDALLGSEVLRDLGALFAVDPDGMLRGVVTIDQVRRALESAAFTGRSA